MRTKSNPSIKTATMQAFLSMPDTFRGNDLVKVVKIITRRKYVHTDSPLRKLRVLKSEGKLNYELAGPKDESLYKKVI